jgi:hypothetical protein
MHQFGHIYALQQELLSANASDWYRAMELWHTARREGVALNVAHYRNILRQCAGAAQTPSTTTTRTTVRVANGGSRSNETHTAARRRSGDVWVRALEVLQQMRVEALRPDTTCVAAAISCCAGAAQWEVAVGIAAHYGAAGRSRMLLDSAACEGVARACAAAGRPDAARAAFATAALRHVADFGHAELERAAAAGEEAASPLVGAPQALALEGSVFEAAAGTVQEATDEEELLLATVAGRTTARNAATLKTLAEHPPYRQQRRE